MSLIKRKVYFPSKYKHLRLRLDFHILCLLSLKMTSLNNIHINTSLFVNIHTSISCSNCHVIVFMVISHGPCGLLNM